VNGAPRTLEKPGPSDGIEVSPAAIKKDCSTESKAWRERGEIQLFFCQGNCSNETESLGAATFSKNHSSGSGKLSTRFCVCMLQ
jgi:hypothetical protein